MRTFRGQENERPGCSAGNERPIEGSHRRGTAPHAISLAGIGSGNSPHVLIDPGKFLSLDKAPKLVRSGGGDGIGEVVCVAVALVAVVDPGLRILMNKKRGGAA